MKLDGVLSLPAGDEDDGSLFGSPPPSPARGRSPQLALPAGPGSAENVGTIALPGSHYCSELAIDPAVLLFNRPSNPDTHTIAAHITPPSASSSSSHRPATSRAPSRAPRNSKNGKERPVTPRSPPPIQFPDPGHPLPSNFLRSQQSLLGHAGLIAGLDPSALSTRYHKGATSQNPIIVEDELDPPLLGKKGTYSLDSTSLPPPSNEEIVSSLVKQRNIFPVLESLLRLLSGAGVSNASSNMTASGPPGPSNSKTSNNTRGPTPKRRRLNSVPAGAADWDVPYPFQQGEGPSQYRLHWEKERLKQLLSQLAVLIKSAKRSAAARTYLRQQVHPSSSINFRKVPRQTPHQQQLMVDVSLHEQQATPVCHLGVEDVASLPAVSEGPRQALPAPSATPQTDPLDDLLTSFLYNSIPSMSSLKPQNISSLSPCPDSTHHPPLPGSDTAGAEALFPDLQQLLAILHGSPQRMAASTDSSEVEVPIASCSRPADQAPMPQIPAASGILDFMIDPTLLGTSSNHNSDMLESRKSFTAGRGPSTPALSQSPIASTSSLFDPLTPTGDLCSEPDVYGPERGMSQRLSLPHSVPQALVDAVAEDPITAASLLLRMSTSASSQAAAQPKPQLLQPLVSRFLSMEPQSPVPTVSSLPFTTSTAATTPLSSRASSTTPRQGSAASTTTPNAQVLSLSDQRRLSQSPAGSRGFSKQEVIRRAKDRRQQLVAELGKAKVELWEATIEQGVLNQLMKDHSC